MARKIKELEPAGTGPAGAFTLLAPHGVSAIGGDEDFQYAVVDGKVTTDNAEHVARLQAHGFMLLAQE